MSVMAMGSLWVERGMGRNHEGRDLRWWSRPRGSGLGSGRAPGERGPAQAPSDPGGAEGIAMRYACAFMDAG